MKLQILASLCFVFIAVGQVNAQALNACMEDVAEYCSEVPAGSKEITKCLRKHSFDLSGQCRREYLNSASKLKKATHRCDKDTKKFCTEVKPGHGRVLACLRSQQSKLSKTCASALTEMLAAS